MSSDPVLQVDAGRLRLVWGVVERGVFQAGARLAFGRQAIEKVIKID